ncbi:MAG: 30S ribosomal protein S15 [bacterium]|nr:30S ribosomal protein S15 [bacterium]MDZ4295900.1 30S ribosomal protein S15 [Patescibacteria group bacterium]
MALLTADKSKIIGKYKVHETDTGSSSVQVAIMSEEIERLTGHLKEHRKDHHSRRGLLKMVAKRKKLLDYMMREEKERYDAIIKKLGLRK